MMSMPRGGNCLRSLRSGLPRWWIRAVAPVAKWNGCRSSMAPLSNSCSIKWSWLRTSRARSARRHAAAVGASRLPARTNSSVLSSAARLWSSRLTAPGLLFLSLFRVDANLFCTMLAPLVTGGEGTPAPVIGRLIAVHAATVLGAGTFVALSIASVQGVLINLLTGRGFRRVSPWVQMALMGGLIVVLFLTPLTCIGIRPLVESHSPLLRWFPPFWFLGLYMDMLPGQPGGPVFHELAGLARQGLAISGAAFPLHYLAGYRGHARRVMQSVEGTEGGPGWLRTAFERAVNRWLLPHPLERATFHFISCTILRNAKQRLFLATYGGIAVALALSAVIRIGTRPGAPILSFHDAGLLSVPLTLSFFAVSGLRVAFNFPAELRANWIFQVCESEDSMPHMRAARKWIVLMGMVPLFGLLAPVEIYFRGWRLGLIHLSFALALALVLLNLLLVGHCS